MSKSVFICFGAFSGIALCAGAALLESSSVRGLTSRNIRDRVTTRNTLIKQREQTIADLIALVKTPPDEAQNTSAEYGQKTLAIQLLGQFRAVQAVDVLFDNLKFKIEVHAGTIGDIFGLGTNYPAVGSLIEIGGPALKGAWHRVEMSDDVLERELCTWVIGQVEGGDTARLLVERRMAKADPPRKKRYEAARSLLEKTP